VTGWDELVALAERERGLLAAERWDEAAELGVERARRAAELAPAPASARPQLERLLELQNEVSARLAAGRAGVMRELAGLRKGATAVRGYRDAANTRPAHRRVDGLG
jgi:hypothetical protein